MFFFCKVFYSQQQKVGLDELQAYIWQFYKLHFCFLQLFYLNSTRLPYSPVFGNMLFLCTCRLGLLQRNCANRKKNTTV